MEGRVAHILTHNSWVATIAEAAIAMDLTLTALTCKASTGPRDDKPALFVRTAKG